MAFCINCGQELADGANFCGNCGKAVSVNNPTSQRKTVFEGELHKCPNCGEILNSFVSVCPACGHELRGAETSSSVREFAKKLELASTVSQTVTLIKSFPIPNTKEDIYECMIIAAANITNYTSPEIIDAWKVKLEQSYHKAKLLLKDIQSLSELQSLYDQTKKKIYLIEASRNAKTVGSAVGKSGKWAGQFLAHNASSLPNIILCAAWVISLFVLIPLCKGLYRRDYSEILTMVLICGAIIVPFVTRCSSWIPKLIIVLGLVLSIAVLLPLCQGLYRSDYQEILTIEIICAIIIVVRMFKKSNNNPKEQEED